jgi:NADH:ubiquinone reductase (H+-translocating)
LIYTFGVPYLDDQFISMVQLNKTPRVVIIGGGFGGLYAAKELADKPATVTLLDRTNHHLFQPLLYQVASAGLSPGDIAQPIRHILKYASNLEVVMAEVDEIDVAEKRVIAGNRTVSYDYLIVAAGARHSYFGHDEWERFAPGLKNLEDALELRRRILKAFEVAEIAENMEERRKALTFVVVGAGPTGVEMAGAIAELAHRSLADDFRRVNPRDAKIILVDAAGRILPSFDQRLSDSARKQLEQLQVEVRTGVTVSQVGPEGVQVGDGLISARTIVWAAGNAASPLGKSLGVELDRAGRVKVNQDLTIPGHSEVFVIGDMALFTNQKGGPLPGVCPVAMQMGTHAARNIMAAAEGKPMSPFRYRDKGQMATIGRNRAIADLKVVEFGGFFAWLAWLFIHLIFLIGFRNRVFVFFQWIWAYLSYSRGARLIYGVFKPQSEREKEKTVAEANSR